MARIAQQQMLVVADQRQPILECRIDVHVTGGAGAHTAAGVLDFPAVLYTAPGIRLLDNLWRHMLADLEPEPASPVAG